jgi:hypothetical protein
LLQIARLNQEEGYHLLSPAFLTFLNGKSSLSWMVSYFQAKLVLNEACTLKTWYLHPNPARQADATWSGGSKLDWRLETPRSTGIMYAKRAIPKLKRHRFGLLGKQFIQIGKTAALQGYTPMGLNGLFEPNFHPIAALAASFRKPLNAFPVVSMPTFASTCRTRES